MTGKQRQIFFVLFYFGMIANLDKSLIGATAPHIIAAYGFSAAQFSNITNLYYVSNIIMTLISGFVVDRYGYKFFTTLCLVLLTLASSCFGIVGLLGVGLGGSAGVMLGLLGARMIVGVGQTGYTNGCARVVVENFKPHQRTTVQSVVVATAGLGSVVSYALFAPLMEKTSWQVAYFVLAGLFLVALILFVVLVPTKHTPVTRKISVIEGWKNKNTLILGLALFCGNMVSVVTLFWLPTYLPTIGVIQNHLKTNPQLVNLILVGYALAMGIAMVTSDAIVKRFFLGRQKQVAFVSGIIGALALYVMTKTTSLVLIVVLLYLSTYMLMFVFAIVVLAPHFIVAQTKQSLIAPDMISSAYATINIMAFVGAMVGNYVVARIADKIGFAAGFGALAVPFVLMSVCLFFLPRLAKK